MRTVASTPRVVLLMVPFTGFDQGLLEGIARYTQIHGPWVLYRPNDYPEVPSPASESTGGSFSGREYFSAVTAGYRLPSLRRWGATGVIGRVRTARLAQRVLQAGLPIVGIDLPQALVTSEGPLAQLSEIRTNSELAGRMAAEHFLDRGFRHFGFCGFSGRDWSQRRQESFAERVAAAGFACDAYQPPRQRECTSWDGEQARVIAWLSSLPKPAAVMACNDDRGRQVLEASLLGGLTVPDDVAVVGADDDHVVCNLSNPPLSSVAFGLEQAGYQAAELLDGLMSGRIEGPRRIEVDPLWVVARRSTDVIACDDRHVTAALRFIRDHVRESIGVNDVVAVSGISRRGLELRFRAALGRSIRHEIQRGRLAYTRQLLLETNLPAGRIAELAGFRSLPYLSSVFHRAMGVTLGQYRRRARRP